MERGGWPGLERFAKPRGFVQSDSSPGHPAALADRIPRLLGATASRPETGFMRRGAWTTSQATASPAPPRAIRDLSLRPNDPAQQRRGLLKL